MTNELMTIIYILGGIASLMKIFEFIDKYFGAKIIKLFSKKSEQKSVINIKFYSAITNLVLIAVVAIGLLYYKSFSILGLITFIASATLLLITLVFFVVKRIISSWSKDLDKINLPE